MTTENTSDNPQYGPTAADIFAITDGANCSLANHLEAAAKLAAGLKKLNEAVLLQSEFPDDERQQEVTAAWQRLCLMVESEAAHAH